VASRVTLFRASAKNLTVPEGSLAAFAFRTRE
jgi:hypothetical protein